MFITDRITSQSTKIQLPGLALKVVPYKENFLVCSLSAMLKYAADLIIIDLGSKEITQTFKRSYSDNYSIESLTFTNNHIFTRHGNRKVYFVDRKNNKYVALVETRDYCSNLWQYDNYLFIPQKWRDSYDHSIDIWDIRTLKKIACLKDLKLQNMVYQNGQIIAGCQSYPLEANSIYCYEVSTSVVIYDFRVLHHEETLKNTCPDFLKDMKLKPKKMTPENVAHALWLKNASSSEKPASSLLHFSLWAKNKKLSFGKEEVKKIVDSTYQMK